MQTIVVTSNTSKIIKGDTTLHLKVLLSNITFLFCCFDVLLHVDMHINCSFSH